MSLWAGVWLVAAKECRQLARDRYTLLLVLAVPLLQLVLLGYAFDTRARNLPVAVLDEDGGRMSRMLMGRFAAHPAFVMSGGARSEAQLLELLKRGEVKLAIAIPKHYSEDTFSGRQSVVRVWVDGSDASSSAQALAEAKSIGYSHQADLASMGFEQRRGGVQLETQVLYNPEGRSAVSIVPALVAILTELAARLLVSLSFVREKERGTADRLRSTGLGLGAIVGGKLMVGTMVGMVTGAGLSMIMSGLFGIPIGSALWLYGLGMLAVIVPGLGLGLWLSAEARNQAQSLQLNFLVALPSILLSGLLFPRGGMPPFLEGLSQLLPSTWSIELMRGMVLRGFAAEALSSSMIALVGLGGLYLVVGALRIRRVGGGWR